MWDGLRKYAAACAVAIAGVLLTCLSSWNVHEELQANYHKEFQWAAYDRIEAVRSLVEQGLGTLFEIRSLLDAAPGISGSEFSLFARSILQRHPYIEKLLWVPMSAMPAASQGKQLGVKQLRETPSLLIDGAAMARVPVALAVSRIGLAVATSHELEGDSGLPELFERAVASGQVAVGGRSLLVLPDQARLNVIYALLPVHASEQLPGSTGETLQRAAAPLGFVVGIYRIEELVHMAISRLEPRGVDVLVSDESAPSDTQFLHFYASRLAPGRTATAAGGAVDEGDGEQARRVARIRAGDRTWSVTCVATHTFRSAAAFREAHWLLLLGGVLCTALVTFYLVRSRRELDYRIRLAQTIREREELFRQLAETVDVIFWATDAKATRLEYIGPAFGQFVARPPVPDAGDSATPSLLLDIFAPRERSMLSAAIARLQDERRRFTVLLPARRRPDEPRWLRVCGFPVHEKGGELMRIVGFCEDVTEHKLADDALRDSEARLQTLFNHSPDLIFTVDAQARILFINRPLPPPLEGSGEMRSEFILPPAVRDDYLGRLREVFASGKVEHCQYKSNDAIWREIRMVPITATNAANAANAVMAAMVVITDITEKRKLQWQANRHARLAALGVLSAGIAHEISNPNHAILANVTLLTRIWHDALPILCEYEQENGDFLLAGLRFSQAREIISRGMRDIGDNAGRVQKIVDNLKHLGRHDRGHMDEMADVAKLLQTVVNLLEIRIRKHTDRLLLNLPDALPPVRGNVQQLEQVFINVIVNALEALPERSRSVTVSARVDRAGGRIVVCVEDQGQGISADAMHQVGEPFFTTKGESGGTGLGLSISTSIVERHGGVLKIEANPDLGTTVTIELPFGTEE